MATYKQPCMQCGEMIERDSRFCPKCASGSPLGYHCPACIKEIGRGDAVCAGCGRNLTALCPFCGQPIFAGSEKCDACKISLMIRCENSRCGQLQFFENVRCTACGKPIKKAHKQIEARKKGAI